MSKKESTLKREKSPVAVKKFNNLGYVDLVRMCP